jgi:quercetin dioxygenase-like cupin family protein
MSIIKQALAELETKNNPVAKVLHKAADSKAIIMVFKKGMMLKEHKSALPAKLTIFNGAVSFVMLGETTILNQYDTMDIPMNEVHAVTALEDTVALLTQG